VAVHLFDQTEPLERLLAFRKPEGDLPDLGLLGLARERQDLVEVGRLLTPLCHRVFLMSEVPLHGVG